MLGALKTELKRPATLVSVVLALISVMFSFYLFEKGVKAGKLVYDTQQILVFNQNGIGYGQDQSSGPFFVVDALGHKIVENIYVATIKVWNSGNEDIRQDSVRIPFRVKIDGKAKVMAFSILYASMDNADSFTLSNNGQLDWKHFDPQQGIVMQLVYSAQEQRKVEFDGYAAGSSRTVNLSISRNPPYVISQSTNDKILIVLAIIISLIVTVLLLSPRGRHLLKEEGITPSIAILLPVVFIISSYLFEWITASPVAPF